MESASNIVHRAVIVFPVADGGRTLDDSMDSCSGGCGGSLGTRPFGNAQETNFNQASNTDQSINFPDLISRCCSVSIERKVRFFRLIFTTKLFKLSVWVRALQPAKINY